MVLTNVQNYDLKVCSFLIKRSKGKGKATPAQAQIGSRRLRLPGFSENRHVKVA